MQGVFPWGGTLLVLFHKLIVKHSTLVGVNQSISKFMDKDIFMFGDSGNSSIASMLPALIQNRGLDPNAVFAMMGNRQGGGFGNGNDFFAILLLFILMGAWGNNGFGGGFGGNNGGGLPLNMLANDSSRELIMSTLQRNGLDVSQLASTLNCSIGQVTSGINALATQISTLAGQQGLSAQQIINSIQAGNCQLSSQLAECCCNVRTAIERQGYESQLAVCNQTNTLVGTANQNTLALRDAGTANTNAIIGKLDQMQNQALQDKIDALRERNTTLLNQLSQEHQNAYFAQVSAQTIAPVNAALGDLSNRLAAIECKQPATVTVPYVPAMSNLVPVNYGINVNPFAASTLGSCGC